MQIENINFGLSGMSDDDYDEFLGFGKKAKKRRKERRARRKEKRTIRFERRKLKNDDRRADTEAKRAQTAVMNATMMPSSPVSTAGITRPGSPIQTQSIMASPSRPIDQVQGDVSTPQKAGFGGNALLIGFAVLVVGGLIVSQKKKGLPKVTS